MLEDKLTSILQKYLGEYFSGLSKEALKVSVWKGDIELKNIRLRPEALRRLQLPVVIKLVAHELVSQEMKKQKGKAPRNAALPAQLDAEDWTQLQALLPEATNSETTVSEIVHTRWSVHVKESRSVIKDSHGVSLLSLNCKRIQVASIQQAHVLFIKSSLDRIIEFFQSNDALSPALALDTADAFEIVNASASLGYQPAATESHTLKSIPVLEDCTFVSSIEQIWVPQPDFPTLRIREGCENLNRHAFQAGFCDGL
ncbi:unnamed protein product [Closterium sp. NIES-64]|nr:unnamed protein product [Closterium sp. NIES-64]